MRQVGIDVLASRYFHVCSIVDGAALGQIGRRRLPLAGLDRHGFPNEYASWAFASSEPIARGSRPILVDMDGTLSNPLHRRHYLLADPPDWVSFSLTADQDSPRLSVISWLRCNYTNHPVIIVSGRPSYVLALTRLWLTKFEVRWDVIALRPEGDTLPGFHHKVRIASALKEYGFNPLFALDDSVQASLAYSKVGIKCFTCIRDGVLGY